MNIVIIFLMVLAVAAVIAYPFFYVPVFEPVADARDNRDRLEREKSIALMAIREADMDRAMGKLSDDDYGSLRVQYEQRAVQALSALDSLSAASSPTGNGGSLERTQTARFCVGCGRGFRPDERFCPACGKARTGLA